MLLTILAIWFGYKKAKSTGRNPFLWALIAGGVFIGTQLLCAVGIGFFLGIGVEFWGWPETIYDDYTWPITFVSIIASIGALLLVFRYLDKVPEEESLSEPPPPPTFGENS